MDHTLSTRRVEALAAEGRASNRSTAKTTGSGSDGARRRMLLPYAASLLPASEAIRQEVNAALEAEVGVVVVENVNSALRRAGDLRGQVDQKCWSCFAYVHNHRRFVRGKRAGKAPIEILTERIEKAG